MDFKTLADQLSNPKGDTGIAVSKQMHQSNIGMTLAAFDLLAIREKDLVLEIGHGNCAHLKQVVSINADFNYYGIELSHTMYEEAVNLNRGLIDKKVAGFYLYDGDKLDFDDLLFDKVVTVNTIYFWKDPDRFLQDIYRVLKPEGILCIAFANKSFMKSLPFVQYGFQMYDPEEVIRLGYSNNFKGYKVENRTEDIINNAGESVRREYSVVLFKK